MPVPNSFANVTTSIPLSQLDANFNTPITLGNTAIQLGNTVTTLNNMTLANVTVSSGNVTITNVTVTTANVTTANIANVIVTGTGTFAAGSNTAPSITFTGDTNTGIYSPGADQVAIATGGSKRFEVDAAGNAGLGVTPSAWKSNYRAVQVGNGMQLVGRTDANWPYIGSNWFVNSSNQDIYQNNGNATIYTQNAGSHIWYTAPSGTAGNAITFTQVMAVEGGKSLALEGATSQSGTGITFPATQSASSNANTLDDYEEGTFEPTLTTTGGSVTISASYNTLAYTKIGRVVVITGQVVVDGVSSPTGTLTFGNLPFALASLTDAAAQARPSIHIFANGTGTPSNSYFPAFLAFAEGSTSGTVVATYNATYDDSIANWMGAGSDLFINFSYITT